MKHNDNIETLLSHYFDGTSTLDEERALRSYFSGNKIDPAHAIYRDMFRSLDDIAIPGDLEDRINNTIDHLERRRRTGRLGLRRFVIRFSTIAACIAIVLAIALPHRSTSTGNEDILCGMTPEEVAAHTTMALQLMSRTINAGQNSATRALESLSQDK